MISFKGAYVPTDMILTGVRWYVACPLSYRHVEERMQERGVPVDHATSQRWVVQDSPQLEEVLHRRKHLVWVRWRMAETSMRGKGQWYDMLKQRQLVVEEGDEDLTAAAQFYALAASSPHRPSQLTSNYLSTKMRDRTPMLRESTTTHESRIYQAAITFPPAVPVLGPAPAGCSAYECVLAAPPARHRGRGDPERH